MFANYQSREIAVTVLHLWNAPEIVKEYLNTGDEGMRQEAHDIACDHAGVSKHPFSSNLFAYSQHRRSECPKVAELAALAAVYATWYLGTCAAQRENAEAVQDIVHSALSA